MQGPESGVHCSTEQVSEDDVERGKTTERQPKWGGNVIMADVIHPCIDWVNARSGHNKETTFLGTLMTVPWNGSLLILYLIPNGALYPGQNSSVVKVIDNSDHRAIRFNIHDGGMSSTVI